MKLWIVGQTREYGPPQQGSRWDFQGVFDSERKALAACKTPAYWIAPIELNQELPEEPLELPGACFPLGDWGKIEA